MDRYHHVPTLRSVRPLAHSLAGIYLRNKLLLGQKSPVDWDGEFIEDAPLLLRGHLLVQAAPQQDNAWRLIYNGAVFPPFARQREPCG